jgi:hypothetical protein
MKEPKKNIAGDLLVALVIIGVVLWVLAKAGG